jgi:hypothetical protein
MQEEMEKAIGIQKKKRLKHEEKIKQITSGNRV